MKTKVLLLLLGAMTFVACTSAEEGEGPSEAPPSNTTPGQTTVLASPVILSPTNPYVSADSRITLSGTCLKKATILVTGDTSLTTTCGSSSGTFSFNIDKNLDGVYNFSIYQGYSSIKISEPVTFKWTRDTTAPSAPTITSVNNPLNNNASSITIGGACEAGATVSLSGSSTASTTCSGASTYSFSVTKSSDASYTFSVSQTDSVGNVSGNAGLVWNRDTAAPSAPTITSPSNDSSCSTAATVNYCAASSGVPVSGTCESGAVVTLGGDESPVQSMTCASSSFAFTPSAATDGTFNYTLSQRDVAGNTSASTTYRYVINSSAVPDPTLTSPTYNNAPANDRYYSNTGSIDIEVGCVTGNTVELSGSDTQSGTCSSSAYTFTVSKGSDSTYTFSIRQKNGVNTYSAAIGFIWVRDTSTPSTPTITSPVGSPYRSNGNSISIAGACEAGARVNLSGDSTQNLQCPVGATYSFTVNKSTDATYNFTVNQTDFAGNTSGNATKQWVRDTVRPANITVTSHSSPYLSNGSSVVISGACETSATVYLTGADTQNTTCSSSAYSFTVNKSSDSSYNFSLSETDLAGNTSLTPTAFVWNRDATAPSTPVITSPASSPITSSGNTLNILGSCETGATVNLSGASTASYTCASSAFTFTVTKGSDGTYNFSIAQTDPAGNTSGSASQQWIRDTSVPSTPTITAPSTNPYNSNVTNFTISGACTTGLTVEMSGAQTDSTTCASSAYSFSASQSTDGPYVYSIRQKSPTNVYSGAASLTWNRDTSEPSNPTITAPSVSPRYTNGNSLSISGACETGATVTLSGDASSTTACVSSAYSFNVSKSSDGTYNLLVTQTDPAGNVSGAAAQVWVRDTVSPSEPTVINPVDNPYGSGDTTITITGNCEASQATVSMTGDTTAGPVTCSAAGSYSFNSTKSSDGTYDYTIIQTDFAGNASNPESFQWIRDTSIPPTPVFTAPASNPYYSKNNSVTITVTCDSNLAPDEAIVNLTGDVSAGDVTSPAGQLEQNCVSSPVSFTIAKSGNASYNFIVNQENPNSGFISANASTTWIRDTIAPSAPTITAPTSNPFIAPGNLTITGGCEANATVNLTGDSTQSLTCPVTNTYTFNISKSTDATYNFTLTQTDRALNTSTTRTLQWVRDSNSVPPPTITSPATTPYTSNTTSLTIAGTCNPGYLLTLGGATAGEVTTPSGSLTQTCSGGSFTYVIAKSSDNTYTFTLKQTFNAVDSTNASLSWTRDTTPPTVTIGSNPSNPSLVTSAAFTFSSEAGATFQCQLDSGGYSSCTSPKSYTPSNATHTFYVKATDSAGNVSTATTYTWDQQAWNTLALYHLNNGSQTVDSSNFTQQEGYTQGLTATGSPANNTTGKYPSGSPSSRSFGSNVYYSTSSTTALNAGTLNFSIQGFVRLGTSIGSSGQYYTLASKTAASPNLGWEVRLRRSSSGRYLIDFVYSLNGTSTATTSASSTCSMNTSTWYHWAVTWSGGTVKFFCSSSSTGSKGTRTLGSGLTLFQSNGPLKLGAGSASGTGSSLWFPGALDEVRLSQVVRTITFPTTEFTAD